MAFIISKVAWIFVSPDNLLVLLLLLGAFFSVARREGLRRFGRRLCFGVAFVLFLIAILPVGNWLLTPLENRFPPALPAHVDGIVLLGGDEMPGTSERRGQPVAHISSERYIRFAALARQYPDAKLIYTGGSGFLMRDPRLSNAAVARQALESLGVPVERMMFEDVSRNTHENAVMAAEMAQPKPQQTWLLVTSAFHMPRSMACFRKAGWNVLPATTGYITPGTFSKTLRFNLVDHMFGAALAVREYIGLVAYRLMGYTDTLWPS